MEFYQREGAQTKGGHYTPAVKAKGMLYISGQLSRNPATGIIPAGGTAEHVKQALQNVENAASLAGLDRRDIVQLRIYITDINEWDAVNDACREFFGDHKPARIVVPVPALHFGCLAEIEAVAECREETE